MNVVLYALFTVAALNYLHTAVTLFFFVRNNTEVVLQTMLLKSLLKVGSYVIFCRTFISWKIVFAIYHNGGPY